MSSAKKKGLNKTIKLNTRVTLGRNAIATALKVQKPNTAVALVIACLFGRMV